MSVKFKITGMEEQQDGTKRTDWIKKDGTAVKGKGGTEMMLEKMLELVPKELTDQVNIICSRVRDENLSKDKPNILWLHDTWDDPETQHLREESSLKRFDKLVFVSNYQFQTYHLAHQIPYSKSVVLKNAIVPFDKIKKSKRGKLKLIYHTTPHRGLELLVPIFETLWTDQWKDKIQLDVFSSFSMYGWPQKDAPFQAIIDRCKAHEGINYHAAVDNKMRPYIHFEPKSTKEQLIEGKNLFNKAACVSCHGVWPPPPGQEPPSAPNLNLAKKRLRPEWIVAWLKNPQEIMPGTKMPAPEVNFIQYYRDAVLDDQENGTNYAKESYGEALIEIYNSSDSTNVDMMLEGI